MPNLYAILTFKAFALFDIGNAVVFIFSDPFLLQFNPH